MSKSELNYAVLANKVGRELVETSRQVNQSLDNPTAPWRPVLLTRKQLDSLLIIFSTIKTPGMDISPILAELQGLPELEEYSLMEGVPDGGKLQEDSHEEI